MSVCVFLNVESEKLSIVKLPTASKREAFVKNIQKIIPSEKQDEVRAIVENIKSQNPNIVDMVSDFSVPLLMIEDEGEIVAFEESYLLDYIIIDESDIIKNATLTFDEFSIDIKEQIGYIDISKSNKMFVKSKDEGASLFSENDLTATVIEHGYGEYKSNNVAKKLANGIAEIIRDESEDILKIIDSI